MKKIILFMVTLLLISTINYAQTEKLLVENTHKVNSDNNNTSKINTLKNDLTATESKELDEVNIDTHLQNFQNSDNGINYLIKNSGYVTLKIFDNNGEEVACLVNRDQKPGSYFVNYSTVNLKRGIYKYQLSVNDIGDSPKLLLVR